MEAEGKTVAERAIEAAYERYRAHDDWKTRFSAPGLTSGEVVATVLGNFNYQVGNGGVFQWWDNRYALETGPNGTSVHVVLAALASRYRDFDPSVADFMIDAAAFVDPLPELERQQGGQIFWADEDEEDEDCEAPLDDHLGGERALTRRYNELDDKRIYAFLDHVVSSFPENEDPFDSTFDFERLASRDASPNFTFAPNVDSSARYPDVVVALAGEDGNAFSIVARVQKALRKAGVGQAEIDAYTREAKSGDYDHLLATTMRWVSHDVGGYVPGLR